MKSHRTSDVPCEAGRQALSFVSPKPERTVLGANPPVARSLFRLAHEIRENDLQAAKEHSAHAEQPVRTS